MGTSRILLDLESATLPTANPATLTKVTSSGTPPTNAPVLTYNGLDYSDSTDQAAMWNLRLPDDYLSGGTLTFLWSHTAATSGSVIWKAGAELVVASAGGVDAASYNAADAAAAVTVPGTVGQFKETSIALTMTGAVAGAFCGVFLGRDADAGGDTATGGVGRILAVQLAYTA